MKKLYVVRKYIVASSAQEAIKLESRCPVDDVWVDEDFKRAGIQVEGFKSKK